MIKMGIRAMIVFLLSFHLAGADESPNPKTRMTSQFKTTIVSDMKAFYSLENQGFICV